MSMEPLPHGFEEFSIAMTDEDASLASLWPLPPTLQDLHCYQSVQEVKQRLATVMAELRVAREEVRHKEQNIASLVEQIRRTVQERDLLRQQQHLLLAREIEEASATPTACPLLTSSPPVAVNRAATFAVPAGRRAAAALQVPSFAAARVLPPVTPSRASATPAAAFPPTYSSPLVAVHRAAMIKPFALLPGSAAVVNRSMAAALEVPSFAGLVSEDRSTTMALELLAAKRPLPQQGFGQFSMERDLLRQLLAREIEASATPTACPLLTSSLPVDGADRSMAMALELLAAKRSLPQQGRLVQAVMEAGPLLQNLLVAGPLPQWRNPPPSQALADAMIPAPSGSSAPMGLPWFIHIG